jgi:succinate dehydrogenase hydrophobic membrane anchor protein
MTHYTISSKNWLKQRISGAAILFFTLCILGLIYFEFNSNINFNRLYSFRHISYTYYISYQYKNIILPLLSINLICIYHGCLGMHVIIEDYVKDLSVRSKLISLINFIAFISIILTIVLLALISIVEIYFSANDQNNFSFLINISSITIFLYLSFRYLKQNTILTNICKLLQIYIFFFTAFISWILILGLTFNIFSLNTQFAIVSGSLLISILPLYYFAKDKSTILNDNEWKRFFVFFTLILTSIFLIMLELWILFVAGMAPGVISEFSAYFSAMSILIFFILLIFSLIKKVLK